MVLLEDFCILFKLNSTAYLLVSACHQIFGRFHVLADFDEGKRSCRRKLEKHNNRRRRKPAGSKGSNEKESQGDNPSEDASGDGEAGKGIET